MSAAMPMSSFSSSSPSPLRIGALSRLTGASPKALRLYEELGLLPAPARQGAYRVYTQQHVDVVGLIRQAQALGFKLQELRALAGQAPLLEAVGLGLALDAVRHKRAETDLRLQALQEQSRRLAEFEALLRSAHKLACECQQATAAAVA